MMRNRDTQRIFTAIVILISIQVSAINVRAEVLILYYKKTADQNKVMNALEYIENSLNEKVLIATVPPNPFYEERSLPTNTVMCGSEASPALVRKIVEILISNNVEIRYVGAYTRPEINSRRNTIDIRAVGDEIFNLMYGLDHLVGHPENLVATSKSAEAHGITKPLRNQAFV